jgi:hypothetical protein
MYAFHAIAIPVTPCPFLSTYTGKHSSIACIVRLATRSYAVSAEYMRRLELRNELRGQKQASNHQQRTRAAVGSDSQPVCPRGFGAPQGPAGEVYSTHTTIPSVSSVTPFELSVLFTHMFCISLAGLLDLVATMTIIF